MDDLKSYLKTLGLDLDDISIYTFLLKSGQSTVLSISRDIGLHRIGIYRKAEELEKRGLISRIVKNKTTLFEITGAVGIERLVKDKQEEEKLLTNKFPDIQKMISTYTNDAKSYFDIKYYSGKRQLQQLLWNALSAKELTRSFGYRSLREFAGADFISLWWRELIERQIVCNILANPGTFELKRTIPRNGFVDEKKEAEIWFPREISTDLIKIETETFIYDDVYAVIQWDEDRAFGFEVRNQVIANQEKRVFDILWKMGKEPKQKR